MREVFQRIDAHLKFKRGRSKFLECATLSVTWERPEKPVTWTWSRVSAIKDICPAHWTGPCDAVSEQDIRAWCNAEIERIQQRESQDAADPVAQFWRSLSDVEKTRARREMDWDMPGDAAQQAYERSLNNA